MKKWLLVIFSFMICITCFYLRPWYIVFSEKHLSEGDVVFQFSQSSQSTHLAIGTNSLFTHCGIIVVRNNKLYVYEAHSVVKLTPYNEWKNRGKWQLVWAKTVFPNEEMHIKTPYLGLPYDKQFKFNNNKMYCSELVYLTYKEQYDYEICKPKPVKQWFAVKVGFGKEFLQRRKIDIEQYAVAPRDLL